MRRATEQQPCPSAPLEKEAMQVSISECTTSKTLTNRLECMEEPKQVGSVPRDNHFQPHYTYFATSGSQWEAQTSGIKGEYLNSCGTVLHF